MERENLLFKKKPATKEISLNTWNTEVLENLCSLIADCPHSTPKWTDSGVFVVRSWNVRNGVLNFDKTSFTDEKTYQERIRRAKPSGGDIVITREAPMGEVAMVPDDLKCCLGQRLVLLRPNPEKINKRFLLYSLQSRFVQNQILSNEGTGSTVSNLRIPDLKGLNIPFPSLDEQEKIANTLWSIDEKIELNRQTAQTLEAIAQAIFKGWFVDFNFPGTTGEMQESELGEIPKGWRIGKLGNVCDLVYGKALKAENRVNGEYPVVGSNGIVDFHNEYLVTAPGIVIGRKGTIGEVTWLHKNFYPIDTTFYIQDKIGVDGLFFHYFLLKEQDFKKIASDSAVPGLNRNHAMDNKVVIPEKILIEKFHQSIKSTIEAINEIEQQTQTLTHLRDSLLPKLMKGVRF